MVPNGPDLGPLLLINYINDLDCGITSGIRKLADDSKIRLLMRSDTC